MNSYSSWLSMSFTPIPHGKHGVQDKKSLHVFVHLPRSCRIYIRFIAIYIKESPTTTNCIISPKASEKENRNVTKRNFCMPMCGEFKFGFHSWYIFGKCSSTRISTWCSKISRKMVSGWLPYKIRLLENDFNMFLCIIFVLVYIYRY